MFRMTSMLVALSVVLGCSNGPAESKVQPSTPETFAGTWRAVTPSFEFIRLSVISKSSEMGVLAARLTFSGVAWEGNGRIDADSVVANMTVAGTQVSSGVVVAHAGDSGTLRVQVRPATAGAIELTFVREN